MGRGRHRAGLTAGREISKEGQLSPNSSCRHGMHVRPQLPWASHTHLIVIAGLGNKVLFNSESIWQAGRAASVGCQPWQPPRADLAWLWRGGRGLLPWHPTAPCRLCLHPPPVPAEPLSWSQRMVVFFPLVARRAFLRLEWHFLTLGWLVTQWCQVCSGLRYLGTCGYSVLMVRR